MKNNITVGCLVRMKPFSELKKFGIKGPEKDIPFLNDLGVVIQVMDSYVVVHWQKLLKECSHYSHTLEKVSDL